MIFNERLHLAILRTVRTQTRLAATSGIGEARISRIVNGWCVPTNEERRRIAAAVDQSAEQLFDAPVDAQK